MATRDLPPSGPPSTLAPNAWAQSSTTGTPSRHSSGTGAGTPNVSTAMMAKTLGVPATSSCVSATARFHVSSSTSAATAAAPHASAALAVATQEYAGTTTA